MKTQEQETSASENQRPIRNDGRLFDTTISLKALEAAAKQGEEEILKFWAELIQANEGFALLFLQIASQHAKTSEHNYHLLTVMNKWAELKQKPDAEPAHV